MHRCCSTPSSAALQPALHPAALTAAQRAAAPNSSLITCPLPAAPRTHPQDIEEFWQEAAAAGPAAAVVHLTGRDVASAVKQAGRGSHVTLGFLGNTFCCSSKCAQHDARACRRARARFERARRACRGGDAALSTTPTPPRITPTAPVTSRYRDDYVNGGAAGAAKADPASPAQQYAAAKKAARANRALGASASLSLAQMW